MRAELVVRDTLVRTRVECVALVGALLRWHGIHLPSGNVDGFVARVERQAMPEPPRVEIAPLVSLIRTTSAEIESADERIAAIAAEDPVIRRLRTVPGVGPVTATAFVATLGTWERFVGPHQVEVCRSLTPKREELGREAAPGADHQGGEQSRPLAAGRSGVVDPALAARRH